MNKKNLGTVIEDVFETARQAFFSGSNGDAAPSSRETLIQVKSYEKPILRRINPKPVAVR